MGSRLDKFVRKRQAVKADRATEQGIAGHQAAMKAIGFASGGWGNEPEKYSYPYAGETADSADGSQDVVTPGKGHVTVIPGTLFDKPLVRPSKPGSHTYSFKTEEQFNSHERKKRT